jgi:alkylated DNA repair protein (DNA oxidative demethylase)
VTGALARHSAAAAGCLGTDQYGAAPECCLVNFYRDGAKMGLHQDRDEKDSAAVIDPRAMRPVPSAEP